MLRQKDGAAHDEHGDYLGVCCALRIRPGGRREPLDCAACGNAGLADTKPWAVTETWELSLNKDLLECVCNEDKKDLKHVAP